MRRFPAPRSALCCVCAIAVVSTCSVSLGAPHQPASSATADRAFAQKKWAQARQSYTAFLRTVKNERTAQARQAVERAVTCSLNLKDWNAALKQAESFRQPIDKNDPTFDPAAWDFQKRSWQKHWSAELANAEFCRRLLARIAAAAKASPEFRKRLAESRMRGDFQLVAWLDPEVTAGPVPFSSLPGTRWWWKGVPEADRYFQRAEPQPEFWYGSEPIPLTKPGVYLVEAAVPGQKERARSLVVVTSVAAVWKGLSDGQALMARGKS